MDRSSDIERGAGPSRATGVGVVGMLLLAVLGGGVGTLVLALAFDLSVTGLDLGQVLDASTRVGVASALSSLPEVLAAVLGLSLTVVAIVVQLASSRYPAKIVDLFMLDRVNIATFAFMAASCVYVVCAPVVSATTPPPPLVAALAVLLAIANFALLLPYFAYVFAFLEPTNLISRNQERMNRVLRRAAGGRIDPRALPAARDRIASGIERIADNCVAALSQADRNLAVHSVKTLERVVVDYLAAKPGFGDDWFLTDRGAFGTLSDEFVAKVIAQRTWVETKSFLEYERVVRQALGEGIEVVSKIASSTHAIGSEALRRGEREVVQLAIRFFNTYIRHALNARNTRAVYNILYEYRKFALDVFRAEPDVGRQIVEYLVYYGRTANDLGLPFVTVTVAHDVSALCESVSQDPTIDIRDLVELFLSLDQPSEIKSEEVALVGVRKAQSILGAFFLRTGLHELAERIRDDMREEDRTRLRAIRDELLAVRERDFWEITDRGHNFDYVDPESRPHLSAFFEPLLGPG